MSNFEFSQPCVGALFSEFFGGWNAFFNTALVWK